MKKETKTIRATILMDITTSASQETIMQSIKRGLYKGLDTPPHYIARPANIEFNTISLVETQKSVENPPSLSCPKCGSDVEVYADGYACSCKCGFELNV